MSSDYLQIASDVLLYLISGGVAIYLYMTKKSQDNASRIKDLEADFHKQIDEQAAQSAEEDKRLAGQIADLGERVSGVEASRPTLEKLSRDVGKVHKRVDDINQIMSRLEGEYRASKGTLDMIHNYLLNQGKGSHE